MIEIIYISAGGSAGAVLRYLVTLYTSNITNHSSVYTGTVVVNIIGSFLLGIIYGFMLAETSISEPFLLFFTTGFLGSFTTFSTFTFELNYLIHKSLSHLIIYISLQLGAATVMAAIGYYFGLLIAGGSIA